MKKKVKVIDFFNWVFSDENGEGVTINQNTINNWNEFTFHHINNLFIDCKVIPKRLVVGEYDQSGDYKTEELELIR